MDELKNEQATIKKEPPKLFGIGLGVGSIIIIVILIIGLVVGGVLISNYLQHRNVGIIESDPGNTKTDTNDSEISDVNTNQDNNTSPGNLNPYVTPPTPIIIPKLKITADDKSKKKGSNDPILTVTYSGFKDGDSPKSLSGKLVITRESGEKEGTYAITASGLTSTKYDINYLPGVFTIKSSGGGGGGGGDGTGETEDENIEIELPVSDWSFLEKLGGNNFETAGDFVIDDSGNIYLVGSYYENSIIGSTTLTGSGYHDVFVAKIDPNGNVLWATKASGVRYDLGQAIDIDSNGNIYVAGIFNSPTINFNNSSLSLTLSGTPSDIFIAKLDNSGNWLWAKKAGGTDLDDVSDIIVDTSSNIYITGFVRLDAIFSPLSPIPGEATDDLFVAKMNTTGDFLWVSRASGTDREFGSSIVLDNQNNVYISGSYNSSTLSFGDITIQNASDGETTQYNSFIAKLDNSGNWLWVKQATGLHSEQINDIIIDSSNNLYATGYFAGTASFDTRTISSYGCTNDTSPYPEECIQHDIFVSKIDSLGNWLWAKSAGGTEDSEHGNGLAVDNQSNLYVTGKFSGSAYFNSASLTSAQATTSDIFIAKLNSSTGSFISAEKFGGNGDDEGIFVLIGPDNKEYYLGNFVETSSFGNTNLTSSGQTDIYIGKKI